MSTGGRRHTSGLNWARALTEATAGAAPRPSIEAYPGDWTDPRVARTRVPRLGDSVTIALCTVVCGANDEGAVAPCGQAQAAWRRTFRPLPRGIPSHDTFGRVFARLDPPEFQRCFLASVQAVVGELPPQVVAMDGKTSRRSAKRARGAHPRHLVSAWATARGWC